MTYPNQPYPPQYPQQAPPQGQGYPPAPPQPGYPAQAPGYPPQQAYTQAQQPPPPPLPKTGITDYLDQPAMGGLSLQFPAIGTSYTGIVARELGEGDFPAQTERDGVTPKRFRDGRIMVRMVVPLNVRPDQRHTDGKATLSVQGQMSEALKQAMSAAGAGHLNGIPEAGAEITVTFVNQLPPKTAGFSGAKVYEVIYKRPAGAAPAPQGNGQAAEQPPWTPSAYDGTLAQVQQPQPQAQAQQPYQATPSSQVQPQWPAPGAPLSAPPQPAPPGENPYSNPQLPGYQVPQAQFQPPAPPQQGPPPPQVPGMAGPAQQVAAATQAAVQAGQQHQAPQGPPAMAPPPNMHPYTAALMKQATGQQLTAEDQDAIAAGPPQ